MVSLDNVHTMLTLQTSRKQEIPDHGDLHLDFFQIMSSTAWELKQRLVTGIEPLQRAPTRAKPIKAIRETIQSVPSREMLSEAMGVGQTLRPQNFKATSLQPQSGRDAGMRLQPVKAAGWTKTRKKQES